MKKTFLILALVGSSLVANAVQYRERIETEVYPHPVYAECTKVFVIRDKYEYGIWSTVSITLVEDTCTDPVE